MSSDAQGSLFGEGRMAPPQQVSTPNPDAIRSRLSGLLGTLQAASSMPLSERDARMWQTVVPKMSSWLPEEEAETIRSAFHREMERLRA